MGRHQALLLCKRTAAAAAGRGENAHDNLLGDFGAAVWLWRAAKTAPETSEALRDQSLAAGGGQETSDRDSKSATELQI